MKMSNVTRKERINAKMTIEKVLTMMSEANPGALNCLVSMIQSGPQGFMDILLLDSLGIYGSKVYMLWNDSCGRDMTKMLETMQAFREGRFTREEIHANLDQIRAAPFI